MRGGSWLFVAILLSLFFAVIYYFAPDVKTSHWHWITPGAVVGIIGWFLASIGLRIDVHFFSNYSVTYGAWGRDQSSHVGLSALCSPLLVVRTRSARRASEMVRPSTDDSVTEAMDEDTPA